jgi:uncharacterized membrane protein
MKQVRNLMKYFLSLLVCVFVRLAPRPPNIEPIMFTAMPLSKEFGKYAGFIYASFAIILLDTLQGRIGYWTVYTSFVYGLVGYASALWLSRQKTTKGKDYAVFAFFATIFYDMTTALIFGFQFGQGLEATLVGQVPFTLYHLIGNLIFAYFLSPIVHKWVIANPRLELNLAIQ